MTHRTVSRIAAVSAKLAALYPELAERQAAQAILDGFTGDSLPDTRARVALAILKIAGADRQQLENWTSAANADYRDVLAWAEYPRLMQAGARIDPRRRQQLAAEDERAYAAWLGAADA